MSTNGTWPRLRTYFLTGLLVLGPSAITLWVLFRFLSVLDSLLGKYIKFPALEAPWLPEGRIPGLGLIAMILLLLLAGFVASSLAGTGALAAWERVLTRLPLARIIYSATKGLGEAFLSGRRTAFRQVLLVEYPRPGVWVIGFRSADPPPELHEKAGTRLVSVFIPNTPNPTSGYFRLVPEANVRPLALSVEQAVKLIASAGVVQTPAEAVKAPNPEAPHGPDPV
ncbi:MAG: DUF502 domain-containing protein [Candidatus Eiseniibacteriota bacterium]